MDSYIHLIRTNIKYATEFFRILKELITDDEHSYDLQYSLTPVEYRTNFHKPDYNDDGFMRIVLKPIDGDVNHPDNDGRVWTEDIPYPWRSLHMIGGYEMAGEERYVSVEIYDDLDNPEYCEVIISPLNLNGQSIHFTVFSPFQCSDEKAEFEEDLEQMIYNQFKNSFKFSKQQLSNSLMKYKLKST